ncbi:uncharacterized protein [Narcine bancroftii]|uniref:uncharacterized protein n=1 Tax=Narcine bancroftii TaxID=1343680 RepID=UPI003831BC47
MNPLYILALGFAFFSTSQGEDDAKTPVTCEPDIHITGGKVTKSKGNEVKSVARFECPEAHYSWPVFSSRCLSSGKWSHNSRKKTPLICKEFRCPAPVLEEGNFFPVNSSYTVGETVSFECYDGYTLKGSTSRTCMKNGRWNGTNAICTTDMQDCPNPGVPAGGRKAGTSYDIGDRVNYYCNDGLVLVGSSTRECLEFGEWSGSAPACHYRGSFDTPEEVAESFTASLASTLGMSNSDSSKQPASVARRIILSKNADLHIYFMIDASESVGEDNFKKAIMLVTNLIEKIASFDVRPRFGVVTYATHPIKVINLNDEEGGDVEAIIDLLEYDEKAKFGAHQDQRGTNTYSALNTVLEMMSFSKTQFKSSWKKIRFVTILFTDGKSNMGKKPEIAAERIKHFVFSQNKTKDYLDMYAFGITEDVDQMEMNKLSSKKPNEKHSFNIKNTDELVKAFNDILGVEQLKSLGLGTHQNGVGRGLRTGVRERAACVCEVQERTPAAPHPLAIQGQNRTQFPRGGLARTLFGCSRSPSLLYSIPRALSAPVLIEGSVVERVKNFKFLGGGGGGGVNISEDLSWSLLVDAIMKKAHLLVKMDHGEHSGRFHHCPVIDSRPGVALSSGDLLACTQVAPCSQLVVYHHTLRSPSMHKCQQYYTCNKQYYKCMTVQLGRQKCSRRNQLKWEMAAVGDDAEAPTSPTADSHWPAAVSNADLPSIPAHPSSLHPELLTPPLVKQSESLQGVKTGCGNRVGSVWGLIQGCGERVGQWISLGADTGLWGESEAVGSVWELIQGSGERAGQWDQSICLPCTQETTRALRKPHPKTTCRDQLSLLLPTNNPVQAIFVKEDKETRQEKDGYVTIKTNEGAKRACEEKALHAREYQQVKDVSEVVTENFLCTGGTQPIKEAVSCKGESRGCGEGMGGGVGGGARFPRIPEPVKRGTNGGTVAALDSQVTREDRCSLARNGASYSQFGGAHPTRRSTARTVGRRRGAGESVNRLRHRVPRTRLAGGGVQTHSDKSGGGVQTHSDKAGGGVQTHSDKAGGGVQTHSDKAGGGVQTHSDKSGGGVQTHSDKSGVGVQTHSDKSGGGVQTHSDKAGGGVQTHSDKAGGGVQTHLRLGEGSRPTQISLGEGSRPTQIRLGEGSRPTQIRLGEGSRPTQIRLGEGSRPTQIRLGEGSRPTQIRLGEGSRPTQIRLGEGSRPTQIRLGEGSRPTQIRLGEGSRPTKGVGVLSWGVVNVCEDPNPDWASARDFHINLFKCPGECPRTAEPEPLPLLHPSPWLVEILVLGSLNSGEAPSPFFPQAVSRLSAPILPTATYPVAVICTCMESYPFRTLLKLIWEFTQPPSMPNSPRPAMGDLSEHRLRLSRSAAHRTPNETVPSLPHHHSGTVLPGEATLRLGLVYCVQCSRCDLLHTETTRKLEEQHLILHLGALQLEGVDIKFSGFYSTPPPHLLPPVTFPPLSLSLSLPFFSLCLLSQSQNQFSPPHYSDTFLFLAYSLWKGSGLNCLYSVRVTDQKIRERKAAGRTDKWNRRDRDQRSQVNQILELGKPPKAASCTRDELIHFIRFAPIFFPDLKSTESISGDTLLLLELSVSILGDKLFADISDKPTISHDYTSSHPAPYLLSKYLHDIIFIPEIPLSCGHGRITTNCSENRGWKVIVAALRHQHSLWGGFCPASSWAVSTTFCRAKSDGRHPQVLKELTVEMVEALIMFFQEHVLSMDSVTVLVDWRIVNVTPLFKKRGRQQKRNYRPICLMLVVGKLLESIVKDEVTEYQELRGGNAADVVFLDFQKAFDKVPLPEAAKQDECPWNYGKDTNVEANHLSPGNGAVLTVRGFLPVPALRYRTSKWSLCFLPNPNTGDLLTDGASCNPGINITGGTVTLSDGVAVGSVLKYTCPLGFYPYPKGTRTCLSTGRWSIMRDSQGRVYNTAICRGFHCPNPSIEQGTFFPKRVLQVPGDTVSFECLDGYKLLGSRSRTCLSNGQWNGSTTVCEDGMDTCPNPGTPPGSVKFGKNYDVGDKVRYLCQGGRVLIGSHDRTCLESGEWTGSEPRCQHEHAFDLPEEVARHFSSSFSHLLSESEMDQEKLGDGKSAGGRPDSSDPALHTTSEIKPHTFGRKISVRVGQKLHIYILLDISGSITKDEFYKAKEALQKFIDMISRFEVSVRYGVLLFGSQTTVVVNPADEWAIYSQNVADIVSEMKYEDYVVKRNLGTNMTGALGSVYKMMSYARTVMKDRRSEWNEIHHVILIFTDGRANVGGSPTPMMDRIRRFLEVERSREEFLDVYVFGLGSDVNKDEINSIASKKNNEKHVFLLQKGEIHTVFDSMLDLSSVGNLCGFANKSLVATDQSSYPWFVQIFNNKKEGSRCSGSIVAQQWILTAAHCIDKRVEKEPWVLSVYAGGTKKVEMIPEKVIIHPLYNLTRKSAEKIDQFYDYDIALIKLVSRMNFTTYIRPICLPCTHETSVALRKPREGTSCSDHEDVLLPKAGAVEAKFIRTKYSQTDLETVKIHTGEVGRSMCEQDALKADAYENVTNVEDVVTKRFLCTGGNYEAISCKGDSGGPLYVKKLYRYVQVGVISWGVENVCMKDRPPVHARDFHINVFQVLDWLRKHLTGSVQFLESSQRSA